MRKPTQTLRWQAMRTNRRRSVQFSIFTQRAAPDQTSPEPSATTDADERENGAARSRFATRPLGWASPLDGPIVRREESQE